VPDGHSARPFQTASKRRHGDQILPIKIGKILFSCWMSYHAVSPRKSSESGQITASRVPELF
jgi:hypothetical protein